MKNKDITILVDIDDTIEDLLGAWCKWLNDLYGLDVEPSNIIEWDMTKAFPSVTWGDIFAPLNKKKFWATVQPREDAMKHLKSLHDDGYNIYLCTSTSYKNVKMKYEMIVQKYFPYIDWNHVIVAHNKPMIKADFMVDDGIHNLEGGEYVKLLMTAPHNKSYDAEKNGMIRVHKWCEIENIINQLVDIKKELSK